MLNFLARCQSDNGEVPSCFYGSCVLDGFDGERVHVMILHLPAYLPTLPSLLPSECILKLVVIYRVIAHVDGRSDARVVQIIRVLLQQRGMEGKAE